MAFEKVEKGRNGTKNTFSAITFDIFNVERSSRHHMIAKDKAYLLIINNPRKVEKRSKSLKVNVR